MTSAIFRTLAVLDLLPGRVALAAPSRGRPMALGDPSAAQGWPLGDPWGISQRYSSGFPCYMVDMVDDHFHPFSMLETFLYSWWLMHIMVEMAHLWVYLFLPNKVWAVFHIRWPPREIDQQLRHDGKFWCIWEKKKWEQIKKIENNNWIWLERVLKKGNKMKHMEKYG